MSGPLEAFRKGFWHFRHGGADALWEHLSRQRSEKRLGLLSRPRHGMPQWAPVEQAQPKRDMRVGTILDEFSSLAFAYEWDQIELTPTDWREHLAQGLDLIFVESAWNANEGAWQYALTGSKAPSDSLRALVEAAREVGVPTVFWNKEDPAHFDDFLGTAKLFDWVYTTEVRKVSEYVRELGHENVGVLPFAAQNAIHNPVRPTGWSPGELGDVAFGGTYFRHKYPQRRAQLDYLLPAAISAAKREKARFDIFSRFKDVDPNYQFPKEFQGHIRGELNYPEMLTAYRGYKTFLNVNSVEDSESMCARRIYEITACGTPVVSAPTPAIAGAFPQGGVLTTSEEQHAEEVIRGLLRSGELRDRTTKLGQRQIWREHTYAQRVNQVLQDVGLEEHLHRQPSVSAMISTNRPHQLDHVLGQMVNQEDVDLEINVLTHGFEPTNEEKESLADRFGLIRWVTADSSVPLGECYNILARQATGDVVAKIDDDDWYGPHYLFDQLAALEYAGADVVGKGAHYLYIEDIDALVLRYPNAEHKYRTFVSGPTIVAKREVVLDEPFQPVRRGEDTAFLKGVRDGGGLIYSADRFGFIQNRGAAGDHTWQADIDHILATSHLQTYGNAREHVLF